MPAREEEMSEKGADPVGIVADVARAIARSKGNRPDSARSMFINAFAEVTTFKPGATKITCLRTLADHLCEALMFDAYFLFICGGGCAETLRVNQPERVSRKLRGSTLERAACALRAHKYTTDPYDFRINVAEYTDGDIRRMGDGKLPRAFRQGFGVKTEELPVRTGIDRHVVMYFFRYRDDIDRAFTRGILRLLIPMWTYAVYGRVYRYERAVYELQEQSQDCSPTRDDFASISSAAIDAREWLSAAHVQRDCETMLRFVGKDTRLRISLADSISRIAHGWHACVDRKGRCREQETKKAAILLWDVWRAKKEKWDRESCRKILDDSEECIKEDLRGHESGEGIETRTPKFYLYHMIRALRSGTLAPPGGSGKNSEDGKKDLGSFASTILSGTSYAPESVEGMIWALSQYGYQALSVSPELHIGSHLRHSARGESSLHMFSEFYRDHFFHTVEVCYLGHCLLRAEQKEQGTICTAFPSDERFVREWHIASLLHDCGYASDIYKGLGDWLKMFAPGLLHDMRGGVDEVMRKLGDSPKFKEFYGQMGFEEKHKPWRDHGLLGAQHLQSLVDQIRKRGAECNVGNAVTAIAKHNCHDIRVDYGVERTAALLILCDTLQVWQRPAFAHMSMGPAWMMSAMLGGVPSVVFHTDDILSSTSFARRTLARMSSALAVQMNRLGSSLCASM